MYNIACDCLPSFLHILVYTFVFKIAKLQKKTQNTVQVQKSWEIKSGS